MSIATKTGDKGETSLMYGRRVPKSHPQVEAYGCVDELTSALGLARAVAETAALKEQILGLQKELIVLMGELATLPEDRERYVKDGFKLVTGEMVDGLTNQVDELEKDKTMKFKDWVIPGGNPTSAALDLARTACRRAERSVMTLAGPGKPDNAEIVRYLNRLSDLCWLLARRVDQDHGSSH